MIAAPYISFHYGVTVDEMLAHVYGELIYNYYASGLTDNRVMNFYNLHFYGGFFELLCVLAVKAVNTMRLTMHFEDIFEIRHLLNSFFGWLTLLFTGLLARRLYGVRAGVLALVLLLLTPRFLGHSFNNPKDIPFAAMFAAVLFGLSCIRRCRPYISLKALIFIVVFTGFALAIRIGGLLLFFYAAVLLALTIFKEGKPISFRFITTITLAFILCFIASLGINALFSPWQLANPLIRPFIALKEMSHLVGYPDSVIFAGRVWDYMQLTRWFLPVWLGISIPISLLSGIILAIAFAWRSANRTFTWVLFLSVFFPIFYVLVRNPPLYHDMRHFFFILPPAVVLAAGGFLNAFNWLQKEFPAQKSLVLCSSIVVLIALLYHPFRFIIKHHPNEAVYFNQIVGGYRGAFFDYELDYWMNAKKQAMNWIKKVGTINGRTEMDYELVNLNKWPDDRRKALHDPSVVHVIFVEDYPVMLIRLKEK